MSLFIESGDNFGGDIGVLTYYADQIECAC